MPDSRVDTIIDRLRNARSTGIDHRGEVRVPLAVAVAAVHAAADTRTREIEAWLMSEGNRYLGIDEPMALRRGKYYAEIAGAVARRFPVSDCEGDTDA